jgi:Uroporphyrinogen decarboxylase (URO-D)
LSLEIISQNTLQAILFERPEYIPVTFWINPACWHHYQPDDLRELMAAHPILFPDFDTEKDSIPQIAPWERAGEPYVDFWNCTWETSDDGITGAVTGHPLADWNAFESFRPPDSEVSHEVGEINWSQLKADIEDTRSEGKFYAGSLEHGYAFQRLSYLRGYENLLYDMTDGEPKLKQLIGMIETFNLQIVQRYLDLDVALMRYPEDLGMQRGPMVAPEHFRIYIKPMYEHLMAPAHKTGCLVHMHSDGDIRALADDLLISGVDALNLQDLVNGIDWIAANLKGRVCIDLDIDRQQITRFGAPEQIDRLIREEVEILASKEGGLMMIYGLYPGVPLENAKAVMDAMEQYAGFYS